MGGCVDCGSQVKLCEFPIRFDTYTGCSHLCKYCFARGFASKNGDISVVKDRGESAYNELKRFIGGHRTKVTEWCDWDIPLHWGGMSDPFQPLERKCGISLRCLELLRDEQYPFIVSTKGSLVAEEPYLSVIAQCNAVVQISMVCSSYDKMEQGAPTFEERLSMVSRLNEAGVKRVITRAQPYLVSCSKEFLANIPRIAEAGAYGVTVEGMKFQKRRKGLVKVGADFLYPENVLKSCYEKIRDACHESGMAFFCAENRLRRMGDSYACCGCDGLEGFVGNRFNCVSIVDGLDVKPTEKMRQIGTGRPFKSMLQKPGIDKMVMEKPFAQHMYEMAKKMV